MSGQGQEDDEELRRLQNPEPIRGRASEELAEARERLLALTIGDLSTMDARAAQAEQSRVVWELEAMVWQVSGDVQKATDCSKQSVLQGKLAISFRNATLVDRVFALEQRQAEGRQGSSKLRLAAASRRK